MSSPDTPQYTTSQNMTDSINQPANRNRVLEKMVQALLCYFECRHGYQRIQTEVSRPHGAEKERCLSLPVLKSGLGFMEGKRHARSAHYMHALLKKRSKHSCIYTCTLCPPKPAKFMLSGIKCFFGEVATIIYL